MGYGGFLGGIAPSPERLGRRNRIVSDDPQGAPGLRSLSMVPIIAPNLPDAMPELPQVAALSDAKLQRRPGLFGRLGNALSRVDWERVAAAMRDDPSHMQMLMQQRENMAERARQEAADAATQKQQAQLMEIRRLQAMDDLPQFEARPGMTHSTYIDPVTGEVTLGGELPLRPYAPRGADPRSGPALPQGFRWE